VKGAFDPFLYVFLKDLFLPQRNQLQALLKMRGLREWFCEGFCHTRRPHLKCC